ncbi:MAG TPA: F0F1 ATP synthase subunit B [Chloroflexota bacterium]|jgi:F-type H+-transporting ATPase subunit b|nr:F0F1 ATP synthase subunit B [Chloroflexota bacterium]
MVPIVATTPISFSVPTLLVELGIFLGMVWLMELLVFNPVRNARREREANIQAGLEATTATRDEAAEAREEVRRILNQARREAQASLDEVTSEGARLRSERIREATEEFQRLLTAARIDIQAEQAQASAQLRDMVVDLAVEAASRVTGHSYATPETRELAASVVQREAW